MPAGLDADWRKATMTTVTDKVGRSFAFDRIRFRMDEDLLQQAAQEVVDVSKERGQMVFDRYCALHLFKYRRNFEPSHFSSGKLDERFRSLYDTPAPTIRVIVEIKAGPLFDQYIGQPTDYIEHAIRTDPRAWLSAGSVLTIQA
jgi:hypothetical protein